VEKNSVTPLAAKSPTSLLPLPVLGLFIRALICSLILSLDENRCTNESRLGQFSIDVEQPYAQLAPNWEPLLPLWWRSCLCPQSLVAAP
jgi:hypothetical protein